MTPEKAVELLEKIKSEYQANGRHASYLDALDMAIWDVKQRPATISYAQRRIGALEYRISTLEHRTDCYAKWRVRNDRLTLKRWKEELPRRVANVLEPELPL